MMCLTKKLYPEKKKDAQNKQPNFKRWAKDWN